MVLDVEQSLLSLDLAQLRQKADAIRKAAVGDRVFLRGLIEFSNHCRCDCLYCGLRRSNAALERYRLEDDAIVAAANAAAQSGVDTIVLQSGEDIFYTKEHIARIVARIKGETGLYVTLSVGNRSAAAYRLWKRAGADRYLLKHESADPGLYAALHPGDSLDNRLSALQRLRDAGYEVGTGFIVGLPGQTDEMLMRDILLVKKLGAEMCGVGPFLPQKDTPFAHLQPGSVDKTLQIIACLRTLIPHLNIPATTALVSLLSEHGHELALQAGANVIMPNFTPSDHRKKYRIYDGKASVGMETALTAIAKAMRTSEGRSGRMT